MIEIKNNLVEYYQLFRSYEVFQNYIKYAIRDLSPQIFVEKEENPQCIVFYSYPAFFIFGEPSKQYNENVFSLFTKDSWIIASSNAWKQAIQDHFKDDVQIHPRVQFSSSSLKLDYIRSQRRNIPTGLSIVPIEAKHLTKGMIYDDVITKFYTQSDFLSNGFGFALINDQGVCHGFSLTNYPIVGHEIELYVRVGYESYQHNRLQGMGTTLCTYFIEEALKRGYVPIWDSANDISTHIAKKLGYKEEKVWFMYHHL